MVRTMVSYPWLGAPGDPSEQVGHDVGAHRCKLALCRRLRRWRSGIPDERPMTTNSTPLRLLGLHWYPRPSQ